MITLHLLQLLQDDGFGTIDTDLFWEKLPLKKNGVAIFSRGGELARGRNWATQGFDLYCRGSSDLKGAEKLEEIWQFMVENYAVCDLPAVPEKSDRIYEQVRIIPVSNIENLGLDEGDRVMFRLSANIIYKKVWS